MVFFTFLGRPIGHSADSLRRAERGRTRLKFCALSTFKKFSKLNISDRHYIAEHGDEVGAISIGLDKVIRHGVFAVLPIVKLGAHYSGSHFLQFRPVGGS